ncbi:MAG: glycosyltransferase [Patescibacteria group bacterium]
MKKALVITAYDGIDSLYCGVGTYIQNILGILDTNPLNMDIYIIAPQISIQGQGYNKEVSKNTKEILSRNNIHIYRFNNGTKGLSSYGWIKNWALASKKSAEIIDKLAKDYDKINVLCTDTPYLHVPFYYQHKTKQTTFFLFFHSDFFMHLEKTTEPPREKLDWEAGAIAFATTQKNVYFIDMGAYIKTHLRNVYKIKNSKFKTLKHGVDPKNNRYAQIYTQDQIAKRLKEYNIPLNKQLIFTIGRAVQYKGFDELIAAMEIVQKSVPNTHLVILAPKYKHESSYENTIKDKAKKACLDCTLLFDEDIHLPALLAQWHNSYLCTQFAYKEPFGLVPEEVRVWSQQNPNMSILASNTAGHIEQITDAKDGFLVNTFDTKITADKIIELLRMSSSDKSKIMKEGYNTFERNYNFRHNLLNFLNTL